MSSFETIDIPFAYRATVLVKGGRKSKEIVCRESLPLRIRVVEPDDVPVAVRCSREIKPSGDAPRRNRLYRSFDGGLFLPLLRMDDPSKFVSPDMARADLAAGAWALAEHTNPFLELSDRPVSKTEWSKAAVVDRLQIKTIDETEREMCVDRAVRVARDILICTDGRVFRRSPGPHYEVDWFINNMWKLGKPAGDSPTATTFDFDLPARATLFGPLRREEAEEYVSWHYGASLPRRSNDADFEILEPSLVPDRDPLHVARTVAPQLLAHIVRHLVSDLDVEGQAASLAVVDAIGTLHGVQAHQLRDNAMYGSPLSTGKAVVGRGRKEPSIGEIVEAMGTIRSFFTDDLVRNGFDPLQHPVNLLESARAMRRFDQQLLPRLLDFDAEAPPLLDRLETPAPGAMS